MSIEKALRRFIVFVEYLCTFLFVIMSASLTVQIVARYALQNASVAWAEELARYAMVWIVFLGAVVATSRCAHTRIEFFVRQLPKHLHVHAEALVNVACSVFLLVVACSSLPMLEVSLLMRAPALHFPMAVVYAAVPVCSVLMIAYFAWNTVNLYRHRSDGVPAPGEGL